MAILDDFDNRRETDNRNRENASRLAMANAVFTTTGIGSVQYEDRVPFGLSFIEEPIVSYGSGTDVDDLADLLNLDDTDDVPMPITSGLVVNWDQDENDWYIGAWVAVRVWFPDSIDASIAIQVEHHFTFQGIATKSIPVDQTL